ncbi:hypothetical protein JCM6882_009391 [Rhodosporidiobolus microsporus]
MGLSQEKIGKLFARSGSEVETEEILMAYSFNKWTNGGNQHQVLRKLHLLTLYLRAIDLGPKMRDHYSAFALSASLVKNNATPVIVLPTTPLGLEAWNAARRPSKSVLKRAFNRSAMDVVSGGVMGGTGSSENSDAEPDAAHHAPGRAHSRPATSQGYAPRISVETVAEDRRGGGGSGGFSGFFGGGGRSRSNTTVTAVIVAPGTEQAEQTRRNAGAGSGLGTGLLSAPPNYDNRNLPDLIAADPTLRNQARPYDPEVDVLPGYA